MKTYEFTVTLIGYGNNPDEAWQNATEADLSQDATPEDYLEEDQP